jgi:CPA2 family monovalent cation:H+ antiporter-2
MPAELHETSLIALLAIGFVLALLLGLLANMVRVSPIVGYLLAGIAVGPFTPGFVGDTGLASQLAEIGVILLMFGVGLHFSIKDLLSVKHIALPGAVAQIITATAIGYGLAHFMGWGVGAGLVFGLSLSVASTVVLLRALEERNALQSSEGKIAVGWLIVEDLAMVLALVLLPALAPSLGGDASVVHAPGTPANTWLAILVTLGKVALFVALALVVGTRVVPWLLMRVTRAGTRELFTLCVLAIALGIAYGSSAAFDVSFALGAFFAGVILSESELSHQAGNDTLPLKDAFAVLFFVSVGMLFDPAVLLRQPLAVLAVLAIIMLGKSVAAFAIVLAFRHPVRTALTVSASLAQIGEFSFILAGLGAALGLLPPEGRDLILAGALLSIALNPLTFAGVDPLNRWLEAHPRLLRLLERRGAEQHRTAVASTRGLHDHAILVGYGRVGRRDRRSVAGAGSAVRRHRARSPDAGQRAGCGRTDHRRRRGHAGCAGGGRHRAGATGGGGHARQFPGTAHRRARAPAQARHRPRGAHAQRRRNPETGSAGCGTRGVQRARTGLRHARVRAAQPGRTGRARPRGRGTRRGGEPGRNLVGRLPARAHLYFP